MLATVVVFLKGNDLVKRKARGGEVEVSRASRKPGMIIRSLEDECDSMDTTPGREGEINEKNDSGEESSLTPSKPGSVETTSTRYSVLIRTKNKKTKECNFCDQPLNCEIIPWDWLLPVHL
jgi:hypothetical protein